MYSDKLEDISNTSFQSLTSFLNKEQATGTSHVTLNDVVSEAGVDRSEALAMVSYLCDEEILKPMIEVRCSECDQREGLYSRKSDVPNEVRTGFCGHRIEMCDRNNWYVMYSIEREADSDFFRKSVSV